MSSFIQNYNWYAPKPHMNKKRNIYKNTFISQRQTEIENKAENLRTETKISKRKI